ncbi:MAG: O-antigen ligase family protein [Lentisphaeria bacterium]|nr:O-antigen ligase family protein [Lentisphaeria bacterium]
MEFTFDGLIRQSFGFHNPNHAAAVIDVLIILSMMGLNKCQKIYGKFLWCGTILILGAALFSTLSRSGILVLLIALALLAWHQRANLIQIKYLLLLALALSPLLVVSGTCSRFNWDNSSANRILIYQAGATLFKHNIWGVGFGNSGNIASVFLLPERIVCRTMINSFLTWAVEFGILFIIPLLTAVIYGILSNKNFYLKLCFVALTLAANFSTLFDVEILLDFANYGGLLLSNFILSWMMVFAYAILLIYLLWDKICLKRILIALAASGGIIIALITMGDNFSPRVINGILAIAPQSNSPLVIINSQEQLRNTVSELNKLQITNFYLIFPQKITEITHLLTKQRKVILFCEAAESQCKLPKDVPLLIVMPPPYYELPANTEKLLLKKFANNYFLEQRAAELNIPVTYL